MIHCNGITYSLFHWSISLVDMATGKIKETAGFHWPSLSALRRLVDYDVLMTCRSIIAVAPHPVLFHAQCLTTVPICDEFRTSLKPVVEFPYGVRYSFTFVFQYLVTKHTITINWLTHAWRIFLSFLRSCKASRNASLWPSGLLLHMFASFVS